MKVLIQRRNLFLLWLGQLVSLSGDWFLTIALPFYVYRLTGSVLQTGLTFMLELLPRIFLGSVAGVFVDRWDRRRTMIAADLIRAAAVALLILVRTSSLVWVIYLVVFLQAIVTQFFTPALLTLVPSLLDNNEEEFVAANSALSLNESVTRLIGPPLGGVLLGIIGLTGTVLADSATYLFSALMLALITLPSAVPIVQKSTRSFGQAFSAVWHDWLAGLRLVVQVQTLRGIFLTMGILMLGQGIFNVLLVIFITTYMHEGTTVYSWLITAQGIGSLIGAVFMSSMSKRLRINYLLAQSLVVTGVAMALVISRPALLIMIVLIVLVGFFFVGFVVIVQTLLQTSVEESYRGRVIGSFEATFSLAMLVGMLLASTTGALFGTILLLYASAALTILAGLVALFMLRRVEMKKGAVVQTT